jgi:hypothetical protein
MSEFKIPRTKQCKKCPWKVSINPFDIPDGYEEAKHENLSCTIAKGLMHNTNAMACHHSSGEDQMYCVGWLYNQLGVGNNIMLRIKMMRCTNLKDLKVYGKQHERFEQTLPRNQQKEQQS